MNLGTVGKTLRTNRLFDLKSGRSIVVAMDHGLDGAVSGLENVGKVLDRLFVEPPDGVLMNAGMFRHWVSKWQGRRTPSIILTGDIYVNMSVPGQEYVGEEYRQQASLEYLVANGADIVKLFLIFGQKNLKTHADNLRILSRVVKESDSLGLPVMVEPLFWGPGSEEKNRSEGFLADACRIAIELGADIIKAPYVPQTDVLQSVVESSPVPVMMLGGSKKSLAELFQMTEEAMKAGVKGLVFGRNVWQQDEPDRVLRCLNQIVHNNVSASAAMELSGFA